MVLQGPPCGRVGRCRIYAPKTWKQVFGAFLLVSYFAFAPGRSEPGRGQGRTVAGAGLSLREGDRTELPFGSDV